MGIADLPHALRDSQQFAARLGGRRPAVFLDYDGTLTPIVDRPEDAVISESMRETVRRLASRTTVCVVSGRDRPLRGPTGIGVIVADISDPEQASRATAAEFVLESTGEVQRFLDTLA